MFVFITIAGKVNMQMSLNQCLMNAIRKQKEFWITGKTNNTQMPYGCTHEKNVL